MVISLLGGQALRCLHGRGAGTRGGGAAGGNWGDRALMVRIADSTPDDPLGLFGAWFEEARESEPNDHNAMSLATLGADGVPSLRMVLLKGYDARGVRLLYKPGEPQGPAA